MRKKLAIALATLVVAAGLGGGGAYASVRAAAPAPVTGLQSNGTIAVCVRTADHVLHARQGKTCPAGYKALTFSQTGKTGAKGATGARGATGAKGATGARGPAGPAGAAATVSVSASTQVTDRSDSGNAGTWAKDAFTRTVTITRDHAAPASSCGASSGTCWFYVGTIADAGTFKTVASAKSPQAGADIAGIVAGSLSGGSHVEFYASSNSPSSIGVPSSAAGNGVATSDWVAQFFPSSAAVAGVSLTDWSWTYGGANTCEQWVNASSGNTGDIKGVNACH